MRIASACAVSLLPLAYAAAAGTTDWLMAFLAEADGSTDHVTIARVLGDLRAMKGRGSAAAETLSALLPHRAKLYRDRDKVQVIRLRTYIIVTLAEIGFPKSAEWALYDTLAHVDERISAREIGAAARSVRALDPARGRELAPYLLDALLLRIAEEEFSLERYESRFPPEEATTVQIEAVRTLGAVATAQDREVLRVLQQFMSNVESDRRVVREAQHAVRRIEGARQ